MGPGMAWEGDPRPAEVYTFVWSVWIYPFLVAVSWLCRRRQPNLIWLSVLTLPGLAISVLLH
jgi:hypothetical protein